MADKQPWLERVADLDDRLWAWWKGLTFPRMGWWLWLAVGLALLVWWLAPHMLGITVYKVSLLTIAAWLGYLVSRHVEARNARPHELLEWACEERQAGHDERAWQLEQLAHGIYYRRALYVGAAMIAAALGS